MPAYPEVVEPARAPLVEAALLTASGLVAAMLTHLADLTLTRQVALKPLAGLSPMALLLRAALSGLLRCWRLLLSGSQGSQKL